MSLLDAPLPLLLLNEDGIVQTANLLAQASIGLSDRRLCGNHLADLFGPQSEVERLIRHVRTDRCEISLHNVSLRLRDHSPYSLFAGHAGEMIAVLFAPEQSRQEQEQQSRRHEMAEAVSRIALEMAHEVKNPLTGLRGAAQWLSEQKLNSDCREAVMMVLGEAERIRARIDAFLQLGPRANLQMELVNIHTLLGEVCKAPAGVALRCVYDPSLPEIPAHASRLRQAIENLWMNALEAGATHIEWQTRVAPTATLPLYSGPILEVSISNDGSTVPLALRAKIFEPYVTGKQRGSGLGLSIVQQVVQEHGGRVLATFETGRTTFRLQLPMRDRLSSTANQQQPTVAGAS